ncbi:hypothetical protein HDV02_003400 [Globomyces sp. JEL0801]|nr:hypothetical protein HDV02_003400 [Globomyces sp. JEL0801]
MICNRKLEWKQFGKYVSTNKATYQLVKDFGFNGLRNSLKDGSFYKNTALIKLAQKRFKRLAPLNQEISLIVDPKAIFSDRNNSIFLNTLAFKHPEVYLSSLKEAISNGFNREAFLESLTQNDIVITSNQEYDSLFKDKQTILFQNPKQFFENPNNERYLYRNLYSYPKILARGLMDALSNPYFTPGAQDNLAIRFASRKGQTEIVKLLLKDSRVDPSAQNNSAIREAATYGHIEIVKLLLHDSRVDPSAQNNSAIQGAATYGHIEIIKLLLQDSRVDPSAQNNSAIHGASTYGHIEIVKLLLHDSRFIATNNSAIQGAATNGHTEIVKLFLKDERFSPFADYNSAIWGACSVQNDRFGIFTNIIP